MKVLCAALPLLLAGSMVECERGSGQRIPVGVYEELFGQERITVNDKTLQFEIRLLGGRHQNEIMKGEYDYEVLTSGQIHVSSTSSDPVFTEGVYLYHWFWDGKEIIRKLLEPSRDERGNIATKLGPPVAFICKASRN